jgi:hypothetical protein
MPLGNFPLIDFSIEFLIMNKIKKVIIFSVNFKKKIQ